MAPEATALKERVTVTVTKAGRGLYITSFSQLPSETFGPFDWEATILDLRAAALLTPTDALVLVLDAAVNGSATIKTE